MEVSVGERTGWLKDTPIILGAQVRSGFLPIGCPNCHKNIELGQEVLYLGLYRHKECVEFLDKVHEWLGKQEKEE